MNDNITNGKEVSDYKSPEDAIEKAIEEQEERRQKELEENQRKILEEEMLRRTLGYIFISMTA